MLRFGKKPCFVTNTWVYGSKRVAGIVLDDEIAMLSSNELLKKTAIRLGLNVTYEQPFSFIQLYEDTPMRVIPDSVTQYNLKD